MVCSWRSPWDTLSLSPEELDRAPLPGSRSGALSSGDDNPIWVQSMTTPDTHDLEATVAQIHRLEEAGCEIVRVTVPKPQDAAVLSEIRRRIHLPLICDIHFDYKMALAALDHPVDKIRINPGNIGGYDRYRQVIRNAKAKGLPIRISLLGDPVPEIHAAFDILQATQRRVRRPELIACPTCGRLEIDLEGIVAQLEQRLAGRKTAVKVSVLGCVVNGPGEAREADLGIAAGKGKGVIFKRGEIVRHVLESEMVDALIEEIDKWEVEEAANGGLPVEKIDAAKGKMRLPVLR